MSEGFQKKRIYAIEINLIEIDVEMNEFGYTKAGTTPARRNLLSHYDGSRTEAEARSLYDSCDALLKDGRR